MIYGKVASQLPPGRQAEPMSLSFSLPSGARGYLLIKVGQSKRQFDGQTPQRPELESHPRGRTRPSLALIAKLDPLRLHCRLATSLGAQPLLYSP